MGDALVSTGQSVQPGLGRVLGRMGRCVLTYLLLHATAWTATALTAKWEVGVSETTRLAVGILPFVGIPTLFIAVLAVSVHNRMDVVRFRFLLAMGLMPWAWPLIGCGAAEPLVFQLMAQIAFAALIPAPLLPENWRGSAEDR